MPNHYDKPKLGVLGSGMARKSGEAISKRKKKTKKRLDSIMSQIRPGRGK